MNIKRALIFSLLAWVFVFIIWSILILIPVVKDIMILQYAIYWVLLVPVVLFLAKWYFKADPPTIKKGLWLGLLAIFVMYVLDLIITIPFFIAPQTGGYLTALVRLYGAWEMWVSMVWFVALLAYAGWEFDKTFTSGK